MLPGFAQRKYRSGCCSGARKPGECRPFEPGGFAERRLAEVSVPRECNPAEPDILGERRPVESGRAGESRTGEEDKIVEMDAVEFQVMQVRHAEIESVLTPGRHARAGVDCLGSQVASDHALDGLRRPRFGGHMDRLPVLSGVSENGFDTPELHR